MPLDGLLGTPPVPKSSWHRTIASLLQLPTVRLELTPGHGVEAHPALQEPRDDL